MSGPITYKFRYHAYLGSKSQWTQTLSKMLHQRRHIHKHQCLAVPTQRVSKQPRQFRVSVWNMTAFFVIDECMNHITQTTEALVDGLCFTQSITRGAWHGQSLWAGQVNQIEDAWRPLARGRIVPCELQCKHAVASGRSFIHVGGSRRPVLVCFSQHEFDLGRWIQHN